MDSMSHGANHLFAFSVVECFVGLQAAIEKGVETVSIGPLFNHGFASSIVVEWRFNHQLLHRVVAKVFEIVKLSDVGNIIFNGVFTDG